MGIKEDIERLNLQKQAQLDKEEQARLAKEQRIREMEAVERRREVERQASTRLATAVSRKILQPQIEELMDLLNGSGFQNQPWILALFNGSGTYRESVDDGPEDWHYEFHAVEYSGAGLVREAERTTSVVKGKGWFATDTYKTISKFDTIFAGIVNGSGPVVKYFASQTQNAPYSIPIREIDTYPGTFPPLLETTPEELDSRLAALNSPNSDFATDLKTLCEKQIADVLPQLPEYRGLKR